MSRKPDLKKDELVYALYTDTDNPTTFRAIAELLDMHLSVVYRRYRRAYLDTIDFRDPFNLHKD